MNSYSMNKPLIDNEFQNAVWDESTGLSASELYSELKKIQESDTDLPRPLFCSKAYEWLLDNVQLQINTATPFSVKINIGVNYDYFAGHDIFEKALFSAQRPKVLSEKLPTDYYRMCAAASVGCGDIWTDFWHTVPNWDFLIKHGFSGILEYALESKERIINSGNYTDDHVVFLDSVIIRYRAILKIMNRIYNYSLKFDIPEFSLCINNKTR